MPKINFRWQKSFFTPDFFDFDFIPQKDTFKEVNFIIKSSKIGEGAKILDIPCGVGRHSIILASKGFNVVGVDFASHYLDQAKKTARKNNIKNIKFIKKDMRKINFNCDFDLVINMYTSFGYFNEKENFKFLKKIYKALKKNGLFILDIINGEYIKKRFKPKDWIIFGDGTVHLEETRFLKKNLIQSVWYKIKNSSIKRRSFVLRIYDKDSIKEILEKAGFKIVKFYGDFNGNRLTSFSKRIIILAEKK
ncbi:MAG: class I SAM-dependent methyltransferase [Elusimicrobiota bacterium]